MPTITDALVQIRDAAHLNQHALTLVSTEASQQYVDAQLWEDSSTKRDVLQHLGRTITGYDNAQRESAGLRDVCVEALDSVGATVPDLPVTSPTPQWSQQDW